jgi:outer membrane biogenesis lipoprotein LolB
MKRALWLVPALAMLLLSSCAVRATYYPERHWRYEHSHRDYDHDRDDYRQDRWR